jgi:DNA-binding NarL/FixJ family response regulator
MDHDIDPGRPGDPLRVLIVDADERTRDSIAGILCIGERVEVVGRAGSAGPALELLEAVRPDVILVDLRLPDVAAGLAFAGRLRRKAPGAKVVVLGATDALPEPQRRALERVTHGVVRKTFRAAESVSAVIAAPGPSGASIASGVDEARDPL